MSDEIYLTTEVQASLEKKRQCMEFKQKDHNFIVTTMSAAELFAVSMSQRVVNREDINSDSKYQRPINDRRITRIAEFWDDRSSFLPNSVVCLVHRSDQNLEFNEFQEIKQEVSFASQGARYLEILDGQHRINGCAAASSYLHENLIVTLLRKEDFPASAIGMMFTKMNSEAEPIDELHKMHMRARFRLEPWGQNDGGSQGYHTMMDLEETGSLSNWIKILKNQKTRPFDGKQVALKFKQMWQKGELRVPELEQSASLRLFFKVALEQIWEEDWNSDDTTLKSSRFFIEHFIQLYAVFEKLYQKKHGMGTYPTTENQWREIIELTDRHGTRIQDVLSWGLRVQNEYLESDAGSSIFGIVEALLNSDGEGDEFELDFAKALTRGSKEFRDVDHFLEEYVGPFSIFIEENGERIQPHDDGIFDVDIEQATISWSRAELAKTKYSFSMDKQQDEGWMEIYKPGRYTAEIRHSLSSIFSRRKRGIELNRGDLIRVRLTAETPIRSENTEIVILRLTNSPR